MSTPPQFPMEDDKTPPHTPNRNGQTPERLRRLIDKEIDRMEKKALKTAEMRMKYEEIIKKCDDNPDDCNHFKKTAAEIWLNKHPKHNETAPIPIPTRNPSRSWYDKYGGKKLNKSNKSNKSNNSKKSKKQRKTRKKSKK